MPSPALKHAALKTTVWREALLPVANQNCPCIMMMRSSIITNRKQIMNTREILILKALQFKQLHTTGSNFNGDLVDEFTLVKKDDNDSSSDDTS